MNIKELSERVGAFINPNWENGTSLATGVRNLSVTRYNRPTETEIQLGDPRFCLILQGARRVTGAGRTLDCAAGSSFILSHLLPVTTRITEASPKTPYLAMSLTLDLSILRSLYDQIGDAVFDQVEGEALDTGTPNDALLGALGRYFQLSGKPWEANVLAPLLLKEIYFRLLMAPHGGMLRQLLVRDSPASRVTRAISHIRRGYRSPMSVADMAKASGLGGSAFYGHFKTVTGTTPLQYQKDLRLFEARRMISRGDCAVSAAATAVGYDSATQFSREYARKFGASPRSYVGGIRITM